MSVPLTLSNRQHDRNEPNVRGKWQKTASFTSQNLRIPPETTFFRVLCPASKVGNVIGKDGGIISRIGQETGATVRVEETVPGCDEGIIIIVESDVENGGGSNQNKEEEKNTGDEGGSEENKKEEEKNTSDEVDDAYKQENEGKDNQSVAAEDSGSEKGPSAVQKALVLVSEKIFEGESETDGGNEEENQKLSTFTLRLLVLSSQVGCILGKGGSVIKQMASESGAQIRIIPRDKLPVCASSFDDVVQITGSLDTVRKALLSVSRQLLELPPRVDEFAINTSGLSSHSSGPLQRPEAYPVRNYPFPSQGPPSVGPRDDENGILGRMNPSQDILTFRLLCPDEKAGAVIGKGGSVIKALQHESGCEIKVLEGSHSEDRVIIISGPAHPDDRISAPQEAVLRVQTRIVRAAPEGENTVMAKILISSNQIGCLLGKGGAIITEMRKFTGAYIRILAKDQIPKCASKNEEVIQIKGEFVQVQEALLQITNRLREHFFRNAFPFMKHPSNHAFSDQGPSFLSHMGRRELSPPRMYSSLGPSIHKFNADGPPMHGGFDLHDHPPFMQNLHRPVFSPHISERMPPAATWWSQGPSEGGGPIGFLDYPGGPHRRMSGFGGGRQQAIITNTTLEVVVPRSAVSAIYGEDGGCLKQIREISAAKITVTDPKPRAAETAIIISGTPEQTHAAQSLIQAFVISESNAA